MHLKPWQRYTLLEIAGITIVLIVSALCIFFGTPLIALAYIAMMAENIGFYGTAYILERRKGVKTGKALHSLLVEFGPAEALDSLLLRPVCIYTGVALFGIAGAAAGKIVADIAFYGMAWTSTAVVRHIMKMK
jgi:hypothetical protein